MSNKYSHLLSPLKVGTRVVKNRMTAANYKKHFIQGPEEYPTENVSHPLCQQSPQRCGHCLLPRHRVRPSASPGDHYMPPYNVSNNSNQHYVCMSGG